MEDAWIKYAEEFTKREDAVLAELAKECYANYSNSTMLSGFFQGRVLSMVAKMIQPRLVLEIGTYLGYSAMCFAEGLAPGGKVITLDIDQKTSDVAKSFVARSPHAGRIDFRVGKAADIIPTIGENFDLVFIDADKPAYPDYYRLVFDKVRIGGFILADNVLRNGQVLKPAADQDEPTRIIHSFNKMVLDDPRVSNVMLPIRDGLTLARKERD